MSGELEAVGFRTDAGFDGLSVRGTLWGGNLCMVCSLLGTPHLPRIRGGVLFLEDVNEHPYRIERMPAAAAPGRRASTRRRRSCSAPSPTAASRRSIAATRCAARSSALRATTRTPDPRRPAVRPRADQGDACRSARAVDLRSKAARRSSAGGTHTSLAATEIGAPGWKPQDRGRSAGLSSPPCLRPRLATSRPGLKACRLRSSPHETRRGAITVERTFLAAHRPAALHGLAARRHRLRDRRGLQQQPAPRRQRETRTRCSPPSPSARRATSIRPPRTANNETPYTYQIYEPLYGYHYLKRPYELIPKTAAEVVTPDYLDKDGKPLPDDAPPRADRRERLRHPRSSRASCTRRIRRSPRTRRATTSTTT